MGEGEAVQTNPRCVAPEMELQILLPWYIPRLSNALEEGGLVLPTGINVTDLARAILLNLLRHDAPIPQRRRLEALINEAIELIYKCPPPFYLLPRSAKTELNLLADEVRQIISTGVRSKSPAFGRFKVLGPAKTQQALSKAVSATYLEYEQAIINKARDPTASISDRLLEASRSFKGFREYLKANLYASLKRDDIAFSTLTANNLHLFGGR
ncbi:Hypothetical protein GLP15_4991 [Giardia lamblia P15]|uniref:Uncharacterized protein n=1 Tax=Giardia intestinalis (strain P15) TaxID=658858 RepID=E1F713_GIAIA|nr:Hypothetical protein GLP15_4991 [Giardia lamblia P15]